jgi:galactose mutarotase-like enzyme
MIAPSGKQITIVAKDQQAVVVEVGGGLRSYSVGGRELLDGYGADEMSSSGRGQVLIPWPNRLQDGSYEFNGRRYQLPLTEPEHRNAIHGLVRWSTWTATERFRKRRASISDPWDCNDRRFDFARTWANGPAVRRARPSDREGSRGGNGIRFSAAETDRFDRARPRIYRP